MKVTCIPVPHFLSRSLWYRQLKSGKAVFVQSLALSMSPFFSPLQQSFFWLIHDLLELEKFTATSSELFSKLGCQCLYVGGVIYCSNTNISMAAYLCTFFYRNDSICCGASQRWLVFLYKVFFYGVGMGNC